MNLDVAVLTPEKTVLTYRLASLASRVTAHVLDFIIIVGSIIGINYSFGLMSGFVPFLAPLANTFLMMFSVFFPFLYFILLEGFWRGHTVGKKVAGIHVAMADGTPVTFAAAATRNLLRPADMLPPPYFSGLVSMFMNPRMQRIGDIVANTIVVSTATPKLTFRLAPHNVGIHPLEAAVGELKGMTDQQYYALRRFCDRFYEIPPDAQLRILKELWEPLSAQLRIRTENTTHPIYYAEAVVMKYGRLRGLL